MGFFVAQIAGSPHRAALDLGFLGAARARARAALLAARRRRRRSPPAPARALGDQYHDGARRASTRAAGDVPSARVGRPGRLSAIDAAAMAFDSPTRQSWVPMLVDRAYVGNAVGLNSVAFNAPAVIGPAIAGALIVWVGVAGAFYFNAVATLAVVVAVVMMRASPASQTSGQPALESVRYGIGLRGAPSGAALDLSGAAGLRVNRTSLYAARARARRKPLARRRARPGLGGFRQSVWAVLAARSLPHISRSASAARGSGSNPEYVCRRRPRAGFRSIARHSRCRCSLSSDSARSR